MGVIFSHIVLWVALARHKYKWVEIQCIVLPGLDGYMSRWWSNFDCQHNQTTRHFVFSEYGNDKCQGRIHTFEKGGVRSRFDPRVLQCTWLCFLIQVPRALTLAWNKQQQRLSFDMTRHDLRMANRVTLLFTACDTYCFFFCFILRSFSHVLLFIFSSISCVFSLDNPARPLPSDLAQDGVEVSVFTWFLSGSGYYRTRAWFNYSLGATPQSVEPPRVGLFSLPSRGKPAAAYAAWSCDLPPVMMASAITIA